MPAPRMLIATPDTMWSTPKVTVATACRRPPIMPPRIPAITPTQGLSKVNAAHAPNQVPRIIMPSRPMLTTPARSDHRPPRPAIAIGMASRSEAPVVPIEVRSSAPVAIRTKDSRASTPAKASSHMPTDPRRVVVGAGGTVGASTRAVLMSYRAPRRHDVAAGQGRTAGPARTRSRPKARSCPA